MDIIKNVPGQLRRGYKYGKNLRWKTYEMNKTLFAKTGLVQENINMKIPLISLLELKVQIPRSVLE